MASDIRSSTVAARESNAIHPIVGASPILVVLVMGDGCEAGNSCFVDIWVNVDAESLADSLDDLKSCHMGLEDLEFITSQPASISSTNIRTSKSTVGASTSKAKPQPGAISSMVLARVSKHCGAHTLKLSGTSVNSWTSWNPCLSYVRPRGLDGKLRKTLQLHRL